MSCTTWDMGLHCEKENNTRVCFQTQPVWQSKRVRKTRIPVNELYDDG